MSSDERGKNFRHCVACFLQLETDDCQPCKRKSPNGTSAKKAENFSKDPPPQNTGNPPAQDKPPPQNTSNPPPQDKPPPHNTSPSPSVPSNPTQPSTTVPKPSSNAPSSNSPSSHSYPSSSPVEGAFGTSKAPIPTGSESHPITNITGSAPVTQSPSTQTSASANATCVFPPVLSSFVY